MSLEVKACAALTEPERAEILALQNEVYSGENLKNTVWLQTESHFDRTVPCFYLGRENDALTAFLSLFLPTQEEAEVTVLSCIYPPKKKIYRLSLFRFFCNSRSNRRIIKSSICFGVVFFGKYFRILSALNLMVSF